jgi:hypothetical protein
MADVNKQVLSETGPNPEHEEPPPDSETSSATKAESDAGAEDVEDYHEGPRVSRHTRFPTHDLAQTHDIEKTGTNNK